MAPQSRHPSPRLVTLTSDVGWAYAAQMRGVLLRSLPPSHVVEITHDLPAHRILEGAFVLRSLGVHFPPGTIHVGIVDPGVGGTRFPLMIAAADGSVLVGPDNGLLAPLAQALGRPRAYRIDPGKLRGGTRVGTTFDGRDVFAPAAALLARGVPPSHLGPPAGFQDLRLPAARRILHGADGEVLHVDAFGNLITNIPTAWVRATSTTLRIRLGRRRATTVPWSVSYEAIGRGRLGALGSSFGTVEVAVAEGRADLRCGARVGTTLRLTWPGQNGAHATETVNSGRNLRSRRR